MDWSISPNMYLQQTEVNELLNELSRLSQETGLEKWERAHILCAILLHTGIRIGEAQALLHEDFHLDSDEPKLFVRNGKGGKQRWIPLGDRQLREHIRNHVEWKKSIGRGIEGEDYFFQSRCDNKYSISGLQQLVKLALKTIDLDHHSAHSLRHSWATAHFNIHRNILMTSRILGHASVQTTQVYAHCNFSDMLKSTDNLYKERR